MTPIGPVDVATQEMLAYLRRVLPSPPRRVLEVGPGRATLAARLQALGYMVTAVDPDPMAVELARQAGVAAVQADFLALTEAGWDVVLFTRSLHHLADLSGAVEHAPPCWRPTGPCWPTSSPASGPTGPRPRCTTACGRCSRRQGSSG